ncbi:hypothetical protein C8R44DRAFT_866768 [Mycena epipterygia]|nr:hypothetical protein C8R44DRAFT_866768 [Mycena epipterygia]
MAILPPEICALICDKVEEPKTLARLCRTSRLFRDQGQRILYHTVDLQGCSRSMRSLKSWCLAVTRHSHLAKRVHALSLFLPANLETPDAEKVAHALVRCVNLKELDVSGETFARGRRPDSVQMWMIDCPFRLTKFTDSYFQCDIWGFKFWTVQSEIRVLSLPDPLARFPCSDEQLPNLIAIRVPTFFGLPAGRPLQRLETGFPNGLNYSSLAQYSQTLTTLNLLRKSVCPNVTISNTLESIAGVLPALVHLGIAELVKEVSLKEQTPTSSLQKFPRLETFVLHVRTVTQFEDPNLNHIYEMDAPADLEALGLDIMIARPTLRRTAIGAEAVLGQELSCVLTRSPGAGVHFDVGTDLNFDQVSMFWNP